MVISPAVPAPKVGDPITAKWASDLSAAVNSCANPADRVGEVATPYGKAAQAPGLSMLGEFTAPMFFDCRVARVSGVDKIYCYLPQLNGIWTSPVFLNQNPVEPSTAQTMGTAQNPWVEVDDVSSQTSTVFLAFEDISGASESTWHFRWRVGFVISDAGDYYPGWASLRAPLVPIAKVFGTNDIPSGSTLPAVRQLWRGSICIGGASWSLGGTEISAWGKAVGNSQKAKVLDLDNRQLAGGSWEVVSGNLIFNNNTLAPITINVDGTRYQVLGRQL